MNERLEIKIAEVLGNPPCRKCGMLHVPVVKGKFVSWAAADGHSLEKLWRVSNTRGEPGREFVAARHVSTLLAPLIDALEFYADRANWDADAPGRLADDTDTRAVEWVNDMGDHARTALAVLNAVSEPVEGVG